jgi:hypothetical protein
MKGSGFRCGLGVVDDDENEDDEYYEFMNSEL